LETTFNKKKNLAGFCLEVMGEEEVQAGLSLLRKLSAKEKEKWQKGNPVLFLVRPKINEKILHQRFIKITLSCLKWQPGPNFLPEHFLSVLEGLSANEINELITTMIPGYVSENMTDPWVLKLGLTIGMLKFLSVHTLRPSLRECSLEIAQQWHLDEWQRGYCPICGGWPTMAKFFNENGARKLYCPFCETEWRYQRIGCPICQNQNSFFLSLAGIKGYEQYRIYVCDHCKSYLKTVDERQTGTIDLFCADIATREIDELVIKEGYRLSFGRSAN